MERLGRFFSRISQRYLPDPLVLAVLLTLVVMVVAWAAPQSEPIRGTGALGRLTGVTGLWIQGIASTGFLAFALQMCLILLTGYGLAKAPVATRVLDGLAGAARTNRGAVFLVALVSCVACWINWGFGLIVSGLLAGQIRTRFARSRIRCQYPLIVASAYMGMMIWHGGLSGVGPTQGRRRHRHRAAGRWGVEHGAGRGHHHQSNDPVADKLGADRGSVHRHPAGGPQHGGGAGLRRHAGLG